MLLQLKLDQLAYDTRVIATPLIISTNMLHPSVVRYRCSEALPRYSVGGTKVAFLPPVVTAIAAASKSSEAVEKLSPATVSHHGVEYRFATVALPGTSLPLTTQPRTFVAQLVPFAYPQASAAAYRKHTAASIAGQRASE